MTKNGIKKPGTWKSYGGIGTYVRLGPSIGIKVRGVPQELADLEFPDGSEKTISLGCLANCLA